MMTTEDTQTVEETTEMSDEEFSQQWFMQRPRLPVHWYVTEFDAYEHGALRLAKEIGGVVALLDSRNVAPVFAGLLNPIREHLEGWATQFRAHKDRLMEDKPQASG